MARKYSPSGENTENMKDRKGQDRYKHGWYKPKEVDGEVGERVINNMNDIAPDFVLYLIEFPFGDIYSPRSRS